MLRQYVAQLIFLLAAVPEISVLLEMSAHSDNMSHMKSEMMR